MPAQALTQRSILQRAREIRKAIRLFEPRLDDKSLTVVPSDAGDPTQVTFVIQGDITAAAQAMPVKFRTEIDPDTASVNVRE